MAKRKLTIADKYAIQGMLADGIKPAEIAKEIDATKATINEYIAGELDNLVETIVNARVNSDTPAENFEEDKPKPKKQKPEREIVTQAMLDWVYRELRHAGLTESAADRVINAAVEKRTRKNRPFTSQDDLYSEVISRMKAGDFMVKRTQGGAEGVAVMTGVASKRLDDAAKANDAKKVPRSVRGNVWNIRDARMEHTDADDCDPHVRNHG